MKFNYIYFLPVIGCSNGSTNTHVFLDRILVFVKRFVHRTLTESVYKHIVIIMLSQVNLLQGKSRPKYHD